MSQAHFLTPFPPAASPLPRLLPACPSCVDEKSTHPHPLLLSPSCIFYCGDRHLTSAKILQHFGRTAIAPSSSENAGSAFCHTFRRASSTSSTESAATAASSALTRHGVEAANEGMRVVTQEQESHVFLREGQTEVFGGAVSAHRRDKLNLLCAALQPAAFRRTASAPAAPENNGSAEGIKTAMLKATDV